MFKNILVNAPVNLGDVVLTIAAHKIFSHKGTRYV